MVLRSPWRRGEQGTHPSACTLAPATSLLLTRSTVSSRFFAQILQAAQLLFHLFFPLCFSKELPWKTFSGQGLDEWRGDAGTSCKGSKRKAGRKIENEGETRRQHDKVPSLTLSVRACNVFSALSPCWEGKLLPRSLCAIHLHTHGFRRRLFHPSPEKFSFPCPCVLNV